MENTSHGQGQQQSSSMPSQCAQSQQPNQGYFDDHQQMFAAQFQECWHPSLSAMVTSSQKTNNSVANYPNYPQAAETVAAAILSNQSVAKTGNTNGGGMSSMFPTLLDETDMFYQASTSAITGAYQQQQQVGNNNNHEVVLPCGTNSGNGGMFMQQQQQSQTLQNFFTQNNVLAVPSNNRPSFFAGFDTSCQQQQQHQDVLNQQAQPPACQYQVPVQFATAVTQPASQGSASQHDSLGSGCSSIGCSDQHHVAQTASSSQDEPHCVYQDSTTSSGKKQTPGQRAKITRERNREHARSSRIRKKEYVSQLTDLVQELHVQLAEEGRKRRLAMQHLSEVQSVRCTVMHSFLSCLTDYEGDERKWTSLLEDEFWLKQPLTPFRFFPQSEVEGVHRLSRGVKSIVNEAASLSVMVEGIGNRSPQCMEIQAEQFLQRVGREASSYFLQSSPAQENNTLTSSCRAAAAASVEARISENALFSNSRLQQQRDFQMPTSVGGTHREVSSLSSRSGDSSSSYGRAKEESHTRKRKWSGGEANTPPNTRFVPPNTRFGVSIVTSEESAQANNHAKMGSSYGSESGPTVRAGGYSSNDFHDYNAPSLPDPVPDAFMSTNHNKSQQGRDLSYRADEFSSRCSSKQGEDDRADEERSSKLNNATTTMPRSDYFSSAARRLHDDCTANAVKDGKNSNITNLDAGDTGLPAVISTTISDAATTPIAAPSMTKPTYWTMPTNILRCNSATNSVVTSRSTFSGRRNIADTPSVPLPPFLGLGKKPAGFTITNKSSSTNTKSSSIETSFKTEQKNETTSISIPNPNISTNTKSISAENSTSTKTDQKPETTSISTPYSRQSPASSDGCNDTDTLSCSAVHQRHPQIRAYFHINEDDMAHTGDVMMCRFLFRSQDAVLCGALAEVYMQGMLRAKFSSSNKLLNVEMIYDAMGFMQQLESASGNEVHANKTQVIPNSLEMAFSPTNGEARAITLAVAPYLIVSVNEAWTQLTQYSQIEAEGNQLSILDGKLTDPTAGRRKRKPIHECEEVAKGRCACSTNIHFDKGGRAFIDFVCSYPLTNDNDEVTHLLHVFKECPRQSKLANFSSSS